MVHYSVGQRAEVVQFGEIAELRPPFRIRAGQEFTVTADGRDTGCIVTRFNVKQGDIKKRRCSLRLDDVLRTMATDLGGLYPDVVELLRQSDQDKCISCTVRMNATPALVPITELAANCAEPGFPAVGPGAR